MGSSPLARGLPPHPVGPVVAAGIIPARAGFTGLCVWPVLRSADHPRSRGVYTPPKPADPSEAGSSPLARGLRRQHPDRRERHRIIPARAGFTSASKPALAQLTDHPRSRGVYPVRAVTWSSHAGSSPLARGLLIHRRHSATVLGIIPARAGFTVAEAYSFTDPLGSSPLARGLLDHDLDSCSGMGIIPARAGFTGRSGRGRTGRGDHPRSRGVYWPGVAYGAGVAGSSPLARGLLGEESHGSRGSGIIPARAGFTSQSTWRDVSPSGSSPLARGLQVVADLPQKVGGIIPARAGFTVYGNLVYSKRRIIPARAGFTAPSSNGLESMQDHPRSRGVYPDETGVTDCSGGSSPLARGLQLSKMKAANYDRIIPARAGFT